MKKTILLIILSLFFGVTNGATYYVAPTSSSDSNNGDITHPWATWQKAFNTAVAGDTVYFRGGVWYPTTTALEACITIIDPEGGYRGVNIGHSGTAQNPICYFNYPGEQPILDCRNVVAPGNFLDGMALQQGVHYIHFRGLEIRNIYAHGKTDLTVNGISTNVCSNLTFENMSVHNLSGRGAWITSVRGFYGITTDTTRIINSDFYNCADTLMTHPFNMGDGIKGDLEAGSVFIIEGCRFYNNSDDGIDLSGAGQKRLTNCWAFNMGNLYTSIYVPDDGNGFKLGGARDSISIPNWIMKNCISAHNLRFAIHMLDYEPYYRNNARIYNSVFYDNEEGPWSFSTYPIDPKPWNLDQWYNCIMYGQHARQIYVPYSYQTTTCNWTYSDGSYPYTIPNGVCTVSNADFVSVDYTELYATRKSDHSLPDVNFFRPVQGSDLVNRGTNVGIPYLGTAPDIGVFEYNEEVQTDTQAPTAPSNLQASVQGTTQINLSWTASTDNIGVYRYLVYRGGVNIGYSTTTSYSNTGLTAGTQYSYQVFASDVAGNVSTGSNTITATTNQEPSQVDSILVSTYQQLIDSIQYNRHPDDIIYLDANLFTGNVNFSCTGIDIRPAIGRTPVIDGTTIISGSLNTFQGIIFDGNVSVTNSGNSITYCTIRNSTVALTATNTANLTISHCTFTGNSSTMVLNRVDGITNTYNSITGSGNIITYIPALTDIDDARTSFDYNDYYYTTGTFNGKSWNRWRSRYPKFDNHSIKH